MNPDEPASGHLILDSYIRAANSEGAVWNYKGLAIHAQPEIHERIGALATTLLPQGARILDIASGSGAMCLRLKDLGFSLVGCDIVRQNFRLGDEVDFMTLNLNHLLPDSLVESFDCVVATEIIEHLENPRHLLRQCFRALKPGGKLLLSTPNIDSPISKACYIRSGDFRWFGDREYENDGHIAPISCNVLGKAINEAGFSNTRMESVVPLVFRGLEWWKMRVLAWLIKMVSVKSVLEGDILIVEATRPARGTPRE